MDSHIFPYIPYPDVTMGCNEVTEEKAYGSDNEYDGGESDEEAQEFLGENCWVLASMNGDLMGISMDYSYGYGSIPIGQDMGI